jgi:hypothetical protein
MRGRAACTGSLRRSEWHIDLGLLEKEKKTKHNENGEEDFSQ